MAATVFRQRDMDEFGIASGGTGLIHTEPEYARNTVFGSTVVQGIYLLAVIEKQLCSLAPEWADNGDISVKFVAPVKSGDEFRVEITADEDQPGTFTIEARTGERVAVVGVARTHNTQVSSSVSQSTRPRTESV
ncbi:MaoC family dehydratase [Prauserella oleivorans]|uniref:MaoC family dehydratase n=1 Tax=Prauserella oleivorans TaxID=1478153 RepID=A0ABW5WA04_9PSEU